MEAGIGSFFVFKTKKSMTWDHRSNLKFSQKKNTLSLPIDNKLIDSN